jgi:hypothetical protein
MPTFKVWDPASESLCSSTVEHEAHDAREAAEKYADDDTDGASDGIYSNGYDLMTRDEDGIAMAVTVTVEYEPTYYAHANSLPDGYSIHVSTIPDPETGEEDEVYQWEHVSGEVSGHLEGDRFFRDSFGSWDDAVADIREQQDLTD